MVRSCPNCGTKNRIPAERLGDTARCGKCKHDMPPLNEPVAVESAADFDALLAKSPLPVVVDFWAAWCGPCRAVAPEFQKLATEYAGRAVVAKVDTEALPQVAGRYGIRGIPTFIRFDGGQETKRASGAMAAPAIAQAVGL